MSKTLPVSFRLEPEMKRRLQDLAKADQRSLTNYLEVMVKREIDAAERQNLRNASQQRHDQAGA